MEAPKTHFVPGSPKLHFLKWGERSASPTVLLHGSAANAWWWYFVAQHLASQLELIALDLRGHGDSDWVRPPAYRPFDHAEDVRRLLNYLGIQKPVVVGHSMGGLVALAFAKRYPEMVSGIVGVDVALISTKRRDHFLRRLKALPVVSYPDLSTAKSRFRLIPSEGAIPADVLDFIAERSLAPGVDGTFSWKFDRETFLGEDGIDPLLTISQISSPILLVRGAKSRVMTKSACELAMKANSGITMREISDTHHHVILERPKELAEVLIEFVKRVGSRRSD